MSEGLDTDVLIAGAGPVGLSLAIELGRLGVGCIVAERRDGTLTVPKMSQVSARCMEFCRRWGIADEVRNAVWTSSHPLDFVYTTSLAGDELARLRMPSYDSRGSLAFTPDGASHCPQIYFDPILMRLARSFPTVELRYETALVSFEHDATCVTAALDHEGTAQTFRARYLVGCDGPSGVVRPALGIELGGLGVVAHSINIFFRAPGLVDLHDKGWARFYRLFDDGGCWAELIAIDGAELWRLTVFDDPSPTVDAPALLRKMAGFDFPCDIIDVQKWERRDYVASTYGEGRVFIAGDAAHQCSPTGGIGMHTGICEAMNLAWKLAATLQGWGGPHLLASYGIECAAVAKRNVGLATRTFHNIAALPGTGSIRDIFPALSADDARQAEVTKTLRALSMPEHIRTQYGYEDSPICIADGTKPPTEDPARYVPSARPGTRAPHGWMVGDRSTLDLFGDGFVLLRFGDASPSAGSLQAAADECGVPLRVVDISSDDVAGLYGRALVLVRPDGHVAWRSDAAPEDAAAVIDRVRGA